MLWEIIYDILWTLYTHLQECGRSIYTDRKRYPRYTTKWKKQVTEYTEYNLIYLDDLKGTCVCVCEYLDKGLEGRVLNCELWWPLEGSDIGEVVKEGFHILPYTRRYFSNYLQVWIFKLYTYISKHRSL